eukprot:gene4772-5399_t
MDHVVRPNILKMLACNLKDILECFIEESKKVSNADIAKEQEVTAVSFDEANRPKRNENEGILLSLSHSFCCKLLEDNACELNENEGDFEFYSYPKYPLFVSVAEGLAGWISSGNCLFVSRLSIVTLLNEEGSRESRENLCKKCKPVIEKLRRYFTLGREASGTMVQSFDDDTAAADAHTDTGGRSPDSNQDPDEACQNKIGVMTCGNHSLSILQELLCELLDILKERGIMHLIGMRETTGSVNLLPPPLCKLLRSFNTQLNPKSKLTAGARALSKHFHRCGTSWWGNCSGTEDQKNTNAVTVLKKIFDDCVWINMHTLPHDVHVIELRFRLILVGCLLLNIHFTRTPFCDATITAKSAFFVLSRSGVQRADYLGLKPTTSLLHCGFSCLSTSGCVAVSFEKNPYTKNHDCLLHGNNNPPHFYQNPGYDYYQMKNASVNAP